MYVGGVKEDWCLNREKDRKPVAWQAVLPYRLLKHSQDCEFTKTRYLFGWTKLCFPASFLLRMVMWLNPANEMRADIIYAISTMAPKSSNGQSSTLLLFLQNGKEGETITWKEPSFRKDHIKGYTPNRNTNIGLFVSKKLTSIVASHWCLPPS